MPNCADSMEWEKFAHNICAHGAVRVCNSLENHITYECAWMVRKKSLKTTII